MLKRPGDGDGAADEAVDVGDLMMSTWGRVWTACAIGGLWVAVAYTFVVVWGYSPPTRYLQGLVSLGLLVSLVGWIVGTSRGWK